MELARKLSVWYVVATPAIAGLSTLDIKVGGLNYTGFIWVMMLFGGIYLLAMNYMTRFASAGILPCWPWLVWCGIVCLSLFWCDPLTHRNFQDALQLCMPVVVGLLAASAIRTHAELRWLFASFGVAFISLGIYTAAYVTGIVDTEWISTHLRAAALATTLVGCVFLATFPRQKLLPLAVWGACLLMTTLTSSRIAALALLAVPMVHPHFKGRILYKILAAAAVAAVGFIIFNTQSFQQHFFHSGQGTIGDVISGDYRDLGRSDAWSAVWNEAWRRPWLGAGAGAAYALVPKIWAGMVHVHNDYLRIFYEQGLVGFVVFLTASAWQVLRLRRQVAASHGIVQTTLTAAYLGFCAMLISCLASNTLVYTVLFMNPLFVLIGAGYGAASAEHRASLKIAAGTAFGASLQHGNFRTT